MKKNNKRESIIIAVILLVILAVAFYLDAKLPSYHIAIKVIKKAAVYSLVAVSMNLLNGFRVCSLWGRRALCSSAHMPMPF